MSTEKLFLTDPYDKKQLDKIKEFEKDNLTDSKISDFLEKINNSVSKEEYLENKKNNNEIEEILFIEKNEKIIDCCNIHGEKDIKTCRITPVKLEDNKTKRILPVLATEFALNSLGMKEVFITVSTTDQGIIKELEKNNFESLGNENGKVIYLKENEEKQNIQRKVA